VGRTAKVQRRELRFAAALVYGYNDCRRIPSRDAALHRTSLIRGRKPAEERTVACSSAERHD